MLLIRHGDASEGRRGVGVYLKYAVRRDVPTVYSERPFGFDRASRDAGRSVVNPELVMYDMQQLSKFEKFGGLAPEAFKAFMALDRAAVKEGAISHKNKELIAVAVAMTTQCPYCIEIHSRAARQAGATQQEIAEAVLVAASLRAGAAMTHGTHALQ